MSPSIERTPQHLKKYLVRQEERPYSQENHATWRFILRRLTHFLKDHGHAFYIDGLRKTGITLDRIPSIASIDDKLSEFGWGAVPVSGFIPPAAFMEFQSLGILPIARDMRSVEHLTYTPAPDIVHEAAGHAPLLAHPEFAEYLKRYADVAKNSIITSSDLEQYAAIRKLSDLKENPLALAEDIAEAERELVRINKSNTLVSEATWLSRMNWWTAEYGLIGKLKDPKIYGAGLLSSVAESQHCLSSRVQKLPMSVDCIHYSYDITEPQPQLFVTPHFQKLMDVLDDLKKLMAYKIGGVSALKKAVESQLVNTVELDSGIQVCGKLKNFKMSPNSIDFLQFEGPCAISINDRILPGQTTQDHPLGYSSPIGSVQQTGKPLHLCSLSELESLGIKNGNKLRLHFQSEITIDGLIRSTHFTNQSLTLITWENAWVKQGSEVLFRPEWGVYDMVTGSLVRSVFGGSHHRNLFDSDIDFSAVQVPPLELSPQGRVIETLYDQILKTPLKSEVWVKCVTECLELNPTSWLLCLEILRRTPTESLSEVKNMKIALLRKLNEIKTESNSISSFLTEDLLEFETKND